MREALEEDVPAIARLRAEQSGKEEYWQVRVRAYLSGNLNPQKALPSRVIYVAHEGGMVAGFVAGHLTRRYECDGELQWIDVAREQRRRGIAALLVRELAGWFQRQGAARVCVNVAPDNAAAVAFYLALGAVPLNEYWLVWDDISVSLLATENSA